MKALYVHDTMIKVNKAVHMLNCCGICAVLAYCGQVDPKLRCHCSFASASPTLIQMHHPPHPLLYGRGCYFISCYTTATTSSGYIPSERSSGYWPSSALSQLWPSSEILQASSSTPHSDRSHIEQSNEQWSILSISCTCTLPRLQHVSMSSFSSETGNGTPLS